MRYKFYDIESLPNAFTVAVYTPYRNRVSIYILDDDNLAFTGDNRVPNPEFGNHIKAAVYRANPANIGNTEVYVHNLRRPEVSATLMREMCALAVTGDDTPSLENQPCLGGQPYTWKALLPKNAEPAFRSDTDPGFDPDGDDDYYIIGYNSYNYDTTMLALYFDEAWHRSPTQDRKYIWTFNHRMKASHMRIHNDGLFADDFRSYMPAYLTAVPERDGTYRRDENGELKRNWNNSANVIRNIMIRSGRHIDATRLNEKQKKVALKRLCGLIGCQILESDKLSGLSRIETVDEFIDLIAYNVSDVLNTKELYEESAYCGQFETKRNMLETYPELVYEYERTYDDEGKPGPALRDAEGKLIISSNVRRNRLYADSTSQQLASRTLCPEGHLNDKQTVSLIYPCQEQADLAGIAPFDVLEMADEFFKTRVAARIQDPFLREQALAQWQNVYNMYDRVRGHNFDSSDHYRKTFGENALPAEKLSDIGSCCIFYFNADGTPSSCYVTFSVGGIHGSEYNQALYDADVKRYKTLKERMDFVQAQVDGDPVALRNIVPTANTPLPFVFADGEEYLVKDFLKSGFTKTAASWKTLSEPQPFVTSTSGNMKLNDRYVYTTAALSNHEDFKSYYPGLLRQMGVFANAQLGYDRYGEIFEGKERYGRIMKDKSLPQDVRDSAAAQRENVKLILNSASGGGDASFDTPILMSNNIIAMRCIGQLFSWLIGQAQTLEGARVPSTNTDGLYTVLEEELNNEILARESARINVPIEPELVYLISKDANNRVEFEVKPDKTYEIVSASGDLACYRGPDVRKSLDHPALVDWMLVHYLIQTVIEHGQAALDMPFDRELGARLMDEALSTGGHTHRLLMLQNILASSPGKYSFICAVDDDETISSLQHYNRVFMMKPGTPGATRLCRCVGAVVPTATRQKRKRDNTRTFEDDPRALSILNEQGITVDMLHRLNREASIRKIPRIETDCPILIENRSLRGMSHDEADWILANVDRERYLDYVEHDYESNWRNATVTED